MPHSHALACLFTTFTHRTLVKFNGNDGGRILLAIAGTEFDATAGRGFHGPGKTILKLFSSFGSCSKVVLDGMYYNFAGHDASRGMSNGLSISVRPKRFVQKFSLLDSFDPRRDVNGRSTIRRARESHPRGDVSSTRFEFSPLQC
jgi:hypothetical protein